MKLRPSLLCDFYKISHREQYPEKTEKVYSTWTPRSGKHLPYAGKAVCYGIQGFVMELVEVFREEFFSRPKDVVIGEYRRIIKNCLSVPNPYTKHMEDLYDLGYLPLEIKALDEGTLVPFRVPMMTMENTDPRFFWLTNYVETVASAILWKPCVSATIAYQYRKLLNEYAVKTTGSTAGVEFQGHDFSMRGMSGPEDAARTGSGHLLSFVGTDTIPAICYLEDYYFADVEQELVGCSVPATEHSVMCAGGAGDEFETYRRLIEEVYPHGIISIVSDTWDLWHVLTHTIPKLKDKILARAEGGTGMDKVVIRPDSGDPVDIICGTHIPEYKTMDEAEGAIYDHSRSEADEACEGSHCMGMDEYTYPAKVDGKYYNITCEFVYNRHDKTYYFVDGQKMLPPVEFTPEPKDLGVIELLWNTFGGSVTEQGYKVLHPCIGAIYGDAITVERCKEICARLAEKGFASTNLIFGIGSYTYQYVTRDSLGMAQKSTSVTIDGIEKDIFKDPVTDDGVKKSAKGRVSVFMGIDGELRYEDSDTEYDVVIKCSGDLLNTVYKNGRMEKRLTLARIRERLHGGKISM